MTIRKTLIVAATLAVTANAAFAESSAQQQPQPADITRELCQKPENAERPECAALLEKNVQNFVPLVGAAAGLLALGAVAGGGGGGSTTSTTGTTN